MKFFNCGKNQNTHHSSGFASKVMSVNKIQPDERLTTHHILIRVLHPYYQQL